MRHLLNDSAYLFNPEAFGTGENGGRFGPRRLMPRAAYQRTATLSIEGEPEVVLYTRDANCTGAGFLSPANLPSTVDEATLRIPAPDGTMRHMNCHVRRARQVGEGWVEGYVEFAEPTSVFSTKRISAANARHSDFPFSRH